MKEDAKKQFLKSLGFSTKGENMKKTTYSHCTKLNKEVFVRDQNQTSSTSSLFI